MRLSNIKRNQNQIFSEFAQFVASHLDAILASDDDSVRDYWENVAYIAETFNEHLKPKPDDTESVLPNCTSFSQNTADYKLNGWVQIIRQAVMCEKTLGKIEKFTGDIYNLIPPIYLPFQKRDKNIQKYVVKPEQCYVARGRIASSAFEVQELDKKIEEKRNKVLSKSEEVFYRVLHTELNRIVVLLQFVDISKDERLNENKITCLLGHALLNAAKAVGQAQSSWFSMHQSVQSDSPIAAAYKILSKSEQICDDFFSAASIDQVKFKSLLEAENYVTASDIFMPIPSAASTQNCF